MKEHDILASPWRSTSNKVNGEHIIVRMPLTGGIHLKFKEVHLDRITSSRGTEHN